MPTKAADACISRGPASQSAIAWATPRSRPGAGWSRARTCSAAKWGPAAARAEPCVVTTRQTLALASPTNSSAARAVVGEADSDLNVSAEKDDVRTPRRPSRECCPRPWIRKSSTACGDPGAQPSESARASRTLVVAYLSAGRRPESYSEIDFARRPSSRGRLSRARSLRCASAGSRLAIGRATAGSRSAW
jgi:hypothetical protein